MRSIPVTILGGSDRKRGSLPESGAGLHPLATYKGVAIRVDGRSLAEHLVERIVAAEGFGPVTIAGPARLYEPLGLDARIVDTDGSVSTNLRTAIEAHLQVADGPLAVLACDVLPTVEELEELRGLYEQAGNCALWYPLVRRPDDPAALGAFAWKPAYRIVPEAGQEGVPVLPGHLGIVQPQALRMQVLYALLDAAYRTRNRSLAYRRIVMLRMVLFSLIGQDLRQLLRLRLPRRTPAVIGGGLRIVHELRSGGIRRGRLEALLDHIFLHSDRVTPIGFRCPLVDRISLAEDVDTEEEAEELSMEIDPPSERAS